MLEKQDLQAIAELIKAETAPINQRLDGMQNDINGLKGDIGELKADVNGLKADMVTVKEKLESLEESQEETRAGVNLLLNWAEITQDVVEIPLFRPQDETQAK